MEQDLSLNYLYTPVKTIVDPPIETNQQELPLEKLSWEDFEKLCLALVQTEFSINDCEIYGIKGQTQEGLDIFARLDNGRYNSYQCKRYQNFELADLNKAVKYFKAKDFFSVSEKLYLCTSCEWNKTQVQNRFEKLKTELENDNIELVKWDKVQLSRSLKDHPQIVYDFFGLEWVKKFNGEIAVEKLLKTKKLDAVKVALYRKDLLEFYSAIFNIHDPGIPIQEVGTPFRIQDRFIIPDVFLRSDDEFSSSIDTVKNQGKVEDQVPFDIDEGWYEASNEYQMYKQNRINEVSERIETEFRVKVDDAFSGSKKNIIIGDPGAGKSSLLRYLVLDLLSFNPQLENFSKHYGKLLPVWLPFAFITKQLSQDDNLSIPEILRFWLKSNNHEHLFELVNEALDDERLLLIIDGVDEWSGFSSAEQAITRLETICAKNHSQVIYSSRPYGFRLLKNYFTELQTFNLAPLSDTQQRLFVQGWYEQWLLSQKNKDSHLHASTLTDSFIRELNQKKELKKLAETPLLLSILILQKLKNSVLSTNKLGALREITEYLIDKHPAKRKNTAGIVETSTDDFEYKDIFCELAIFANKESHDGVITKSDAITVVKNFLMEFSGYEKAKAKLKSKELISVGANDFGIIIEKSTEEIAFSHKQFQEYLAADYLFNSDEDDTFSFIKKNASNPLFHQVIIHLFSLIPIRQINKFSTFWEALNNANYEIYEQEYLKLLSYEVVLSSENAPTDLLKSLFKSIVHSFEYETDPLYKNALLKRILDGLNNSKINDEIQNFLMSYFPSRSRYRDPRISRFGLTENLERHHLEFLQRVLINGTLEQKFDVSKVFKSHINNSEVFEFIKQTIINCSNPEIKAFAINSIISSDLSQSVIDDLLGSVQSENKLVRFFLEKWQVFFKRQKEEDLNRILSIGKNFPRQLRQELVQLFKDGFSQSDRLRVIAIDNINGNYHFQESTKMEREVAWEILFQCFNNNAETIKLIKDELETNESPFTFLSRHDAFQYLILYFKDNLELVSAVEKWFLKRTNKYRFTDGEIAFACIFTHSEKALEYLLEDLPRANFSHWNVMALLEGWEENEHVISELKAYFRNIEPSKTSYAAYYIPRIFKKEEEKEEAINILEKILFNSDLTFRERAISALIEIDKKYFENSILEKLIGELDSFHKDGFGQYYTAIGDILNVFHKNELVSSYLLDRAENDYNLSAYIIQYYSENTEKIKRILNQSLPLAKHLRLLIIEQINELPKLPEKIEELYNEFNHESESEVKGDTAISLFKHYNKNAPEKIIELSRPLVFGYGVDYEAQRNIAFSGFLIANRLEEYFSLKEEKSKDPASPRNLFSDYDIERNSSKLMRNSLVENFDHIISITSEKFNYLTSNSNSKEIENIWGFFAKYSTKSSSPYLHLMNYISENVNDISNQNIINFLNRVAPKSVHLKSILMRLLDAKTPNYDQAYIGRLLGSNFNDDQVYQKVREIHHQNEVGKILALSNGWSDEPILKEIFDDLISNQLEVSQYVGFQLKFLFRDIDNLVKFLEENISSEDLTKLHRAFFPPMIDRLKRDSDFGQSIKNLLLNADSVSKKISYYSLLSQCNLVDEEVKVWSRATTDYKNDYGYNIVTNRIVRLKDTLHDYYY